MKIVTSLILTVLVSTQFALFSMQNNRATQTTPFFAKLWQSAKLMKKSVDAAVLFAGAEDGNIEYINKTLGEGVDVNTCTWWRGYTPLMTAAFKGQVQAVRVLLSKPGIDVNVQNRGGRTALMIAARWNRLDVVRELLSVSACNKNLRDEKGWTALMWACAQGHNEIVRLLLATKGTNINTVAKEGGTALTLAISHNREPELIRLLLSVPDIDVSLTDGNGWTALHAAAARGDRAILELLCRIDRITINARTNLNLTPLHIAISENRIEGVRFLLSCPGIDVNAHDGSGTIIHHVGPNRIEILRLLVMAPGIDLNARNSTGETPVMQAIKYHNPLEFFSLPGWIDVMRILLAAPGCDVNATDGCGNTALMRAAEASHPDLVRELLATRGVKIFARNDKGETALMKALLPFCDMQSARYGNLEVVQELLSAFESLKNRPKSDFSNTYLTRLPEELFRQVQMFRLLGQIQEAHSFCEAHRCEFMAQLLGKCKEELLKQYAKKQEQTG